MSRKQVHQRVGLTLAERAGECVVEGAAGGFIESHGCTFEVVVSRDGVPLAATGPNEP
jgi:hypothetical protein